MKKIFAISMFSVLAVLGTMEAHATLDTRHVFDGGAGGNFNIATMNAVVPRYANDRNTVLTTDEYGRVQFSDTIDQGKVSGLTDALAGKVDDTQIANAAADVTGKMDTMVPTVQRMANEIAEAVESGVGSVDMSSKVDKAQVIKADGTTTLAGTTVDAATLDKDAVAPTIANVEANFIPNVSDSYVEGRDAGGAWGEGKAPQGSYIITVDVDANGKATYRWIAYDGPYDV